MSAVESAFLYAAEVAVRALRRVPAPRGLWSFLATSREVAARAYVEFVLSAEDEHED